MEYIATLRSLRAHRQQQPKPMSVLIYDVLIDKVVRHFSHDTLPQMSLVTIPGFQCDLSV